MSSYLAEPSYKLTYVCFDVSDGRVAGGTWHRVDDNRVHTSSKFRQSAQSSTPQAWLFFLVLDRRGAACSDPPRHSTCFRILDALTDNY